ncbi:MAG: IS1595 family transposase [Nitrospira sp. SB0667_bin_9]|nr:IS1595 family transposase [Nitrospira sp. SB0667_bin_9]MYD31041.1 IS1595 family transposase [Nitrospira sp. SB0661_bin_20]
MANDRVTISEFEFLSRFDTEAKAVAFFESVRWKDGRTCPHCDHQHTYPHKTRQFFYHCRACRKQFTCKVHTIMHASPLPVKMWLFAMYKVSVARKGISSLQLSKQLGITQKSAWYMLHRIKEACGGDQGPLSGIIEVDETFIGGKAKNKHKDKKPKKIRGTEGKQAVFGMRQRGGKTFAKPVPRTDRKTLVPEIEQRVESGSIIYSDESGTYRELDANKYFHDSVNHSAGEFVNGFVHTNGMESVWAVLKRSIVGTYHHVSFKHLHRYVNEVTFRLNEGNVGNHLMDRITTLCHLSLGRQLPYAMLTKGASC